MSSSTGDGMKSAKDEKKKKNEVGEDDLLAAALGLLSLDSGPTSVDNDSSSPADKNLKKIADWIEESKEILVLTGAGVVRFVFCNDVSNVGRSSLVGSLEHMEDLLHCGTI
jgi:hypothetical protein